MLPSRKNSAWETRGLGCSHNFVTTYLLGDLGRATQSSWVIVSYSENEMKLGV